MVLDLNILDKLKANVNFPFKVELESFSGMDATRWIASKPPEFGKCLEDILRVGQIDKRSAGCMVSDILLVLSFTFILGIILIRFFVALIFSWIVSSKLGKEREIREDKLKKLAMNRKKKEAKWVAQGNDPKEFLSPEDQKAQRNSYRNSARFSSKFSIPQPGDEPGQERRPRYSNPFSKTKSRPLSTMSLTSSGISDPRLCYHNDPDPTFLYTMMLVTCYSEGLDGISDTLSSLAESTYPNSHKMIVLIADGIITGSGETRSTPDICLSLLERHPIVDGTEEPTPCSYIAIADGKKRHNMAKVYVGYYKNPSSDHEIAPSPNASENELNDIAPPKNRCPMMVIVKCGSEEEREDAKPGNRGKRDSQIILMNYLNKVMFNERMTPLEYEMFTKMHGIMGVTPDNFEVLLMVSCNFDPCNCNLNALHRLMQTQKCIQTRWIEWFRSWNMTQM
jgi:chitin synthase